MPVARYPKAIWMGQTTNNGGRFRTGQPEIIVYHYTAAGAGESSAKYLFRPHSPASSAHFVVDRDGTVYQLSEINVKTWHAGSSVWGKRVGINSYGIGIEIANYGYWRDELERWIPDPEAAGWQELTHKREHSPRFWEPYTDKQYRALEELTAWLLQTIPTLQIQVGHDDISPGRKSDPGPAFDMARMKAVFMTVRKLKPPQQLRSASLAATRPNTMTAASLMSATPATALAVAAMENPHTDPEHKDDNLSLDTFSGIDGAKGSSVDGAKGNAQITDIIFYKSATFWGLMISIVCKLLWVLFKWEPAAFGLSDADMADLARWMTVLAGFIGDAIVARGRIKAVNSDEGVARQITFKNIGTDNGNTK